MSSRISWVDNTKAIAILLVVFGHFSGLDSLLKNTIYSFHLPVFLLISGFLVKDKLSRSSLFSFWNTQVYGLIKLYLFFSIFSIFIFIGILLLKGEPLKLYSLVYGTLYGVHGVDSLLGHGNGALWYFPFFVSSLCLFYLTLKSPRVLGYVVCIVLIIISANYDGKRLFWAIDVAPIGLLFLLIGGEIKNHYNKLSPYFISKKSLILIPLISIVLVYFNTINGAVNINRNEFGNSYVLYFINAVIGCWCILVIAHHLKQSKIMELLSNNTLIIFSIHLYLVKSLRILSSIENDWLRTLSIIVLSFIITFMCAKISQIAMPYLNKYVLAHARK